MSKSTRSWNTDYSFFPLIKGFLIILLLCALTSTKAHDYNIYINADYSYNEESANSIQRGIEVALNQKKFQVNGHSFSIKNCDHRGMNKRSDKCIKKILNDPKALVMYAGLHSPPLIENVKNLNSGHNINDNKLLTLIPWAAAGLITRSQPDNWLYRLSIDDKYAGRFIVNDTLSEGRSKIALLLVNDGWGKYNKKMMTKALAAKGVTSLKTLMFERNLKSIKAKTYLSEIYNSGADTIILVANAPQGIIFFKALNELGLTDKIAFRSHWGITGGKLGKMYEENFQGLNLKVIQTSFSFMSKKLTKKQKLIFRELKNIDNSIVNYSMLQAPAGFIHAYDITCLLIEAINQSNLTGEIKKDRLEVKIQLENLKKPVKGLIKTYKRPFTKLVKKGDDNHDALSIHNFSMFYYRNDGALIPSKVRKK